MSKFSEMTLSEYVEQVYFPVFKPNYSPRLIKETRCAVRALARCCKVDLRIEEITLDVIQKAEGKKRKPLARYNVIRITTIMRTVTPEKFPRKRVELKEDSGYALKSTDGPVGLLAAFYHQRYEPLVLRSRSQSTKRLYKIVITMLGRYLGRQPMLDDLNDEAISGFVVWRLEQGRAKKTVNRDLCNLLAMWRWAHKKGYVTNWPDVAKEKEQSRTPRAFTKRELRSIHHSIQSERAAVGDFAGADFWMALFLLCWDTGERIGAVMALDWRHVDLTQGWVTFLAENRKGGLADSTLPLANDTIATLEKIKRLKGKVFLWPYHPNYLFFRFAKIMTRAGLPDSREFKFHAIRKSTASHYEAAGGNATELLGHSTRKVTKSYLDPRVVSTKPAVNLLFRPGGEEAESA